MTPPTSRGAADAATLLTPRDVARRRARPPTLRGAVDADANTARRTVRETEAAARGQVSRDRTRSTERDTGRETEEDDFEEDDGEDDAPQPRAPPAGHAKRGGAAPVRKGAAASHAEVGKLLFVVAMSSTTDPASFCAQDAISGALAKPVGTVKTMTGVHSVRISCHAFCWTTDLFCNFWRPPPPCTVLVQRLHHALHGPASDGRFLRRRRPHGVRGDGALRRYKKMCAVSFR